MSNQTHIPSAFIERNERALVVLSTTHTQAFPLVGGTICANGTPRVMCRLASHGEGAGGQTQERARGGQGNGAWRRHLRQSDAPPDDDRCTGWLPTCRKASGPSRHSCRGGRGRIRSEDEDSEARSSDDASPMLGAPGRISPPSCVECALVNAESQAPVTPANPFLTIRDILFLSTGTSATEGAGFVSVPRMAF